METQIRAPDSSAERVALWRALHLQVDSPPHILNDEIGLQLIKPDANWRTRPDMHPVGTRGYRAAIVARARIIEDLVEEKVRGGVGQYVILGAGLDSFAQRRTEYSKTLQIFELDQPATQNWKKRRLHDCGLGIAANLHFVDCNFERGESWFEKLATQGFDSTQAAVIASAGVSMYLSKEANRVTLEQLVSFAPGTTFAMSFLLTMDLIDPAERPQHQMVYDKAAAAGTPFLSFYQPSEIVALAKSCGFKNIVHISRDDVLRRYFKNRTDGLQPATGEEILIASV